MKDFFKGVAARATELGKEFAPDPKDVAQATNWVKKTAATTAEEATRLSQEAMKSNFMKITVAKAGTAMDAGVEFYKNLNASKVSQSVATPSPAENATASAPVNTLYDQLMKLDDLRQRGILTVEEFDIEKKKVLAQSASAGR